jgi:hypothetical protein
MHDESARRKGASAKTMVLGFLVVACVVLIAFVLSLVDNEDLEAALIVAGFLGMCGFGIAGLLSRIRDYAAGHIQEARTPAKAFRRFWTAVRTGRSDRAYLTLIPSARIIGSVPPPDMGRRIPVTDEPQAITDPKSFGAYWKKVFIGPRTQTRSAQLLKVKKIQELPADAVAVEVTIRFRSYMTVMALLVGFVFLPFVTDKEIKTIRKLLVRRDNRWFFVSGELCGALDHLGSGPPPLPRR